MLPERLAFIDLETTGGNPVRDRITEIGIVEVDGDHVTRWSTLINPERPIPPFIEQLTGISNAMVAHAPTLETLADDLAERLEGRLFIAHNARFDYGFIKNEYLRMGQRFRADVLCTVRLSRKLFPQHPRHNLDSLITRHRLIPSDRHRALADADLIWQFWCLLRQQPGDAALADAVRLQLKPPSLPPHLDPALVDDLPESPGVYLFYGDNNVLLYVGKSVNIRQRVLAHFGADTREYKAMRLTQEIRHIEWQETVGELGALLLESRLIKGRHPIHNRLLRRSADLCTWRLDEYAPGDFRPRLVSGKDADFGGAEPLFGLFSTRRQATDALKKIADAHGLCPVLLGLETPTQPGRPCFAYQIHKCKGACVGQETRVRHSLRVQTALAQMKLTRWAYPGPIGLVERNDFLDLEDVHLVDGWRYLGTAKCAADVHDLLAQAASVSFDRDTYKVLKAYLAKGNLAVRRF